METHCPHCDARYEVDDDMLAVCGGEVRCFHCERVFNVLEVEAGYQVDGGESTQPRTEPTDTPADAVDHLVVELRHDPGGPVGEAPVEEPSTPPPVAEVTPPMPDDGIDLANDVLTPFDAPDQGTTPSRPWFVSSLYTVLIVSFTLGALAQWAWLTRDRLLTHPGMRPLLTQLGDRFSIPLPTQVDPQHFNVLRRELSPDVQRDGALLLRAVARHDSLLTQPLPDLQLTLFDSMQNVLARRTFRPAQYLPDPSTEQPAAPQQVFTLELALEDPGERASGFELNFY